MNFVKIYIKRSILIFNNLSRGGIDRCFFLLQLENPNWHLYLYDTLPIVTFVIICMEIAYFYGNCTS